MQVSEPLRRAVWTLTDQGVVSLGAFLVNILLARFLSPSEYGVFALLFGALLGLQVINGSLLFYPLSIRAAVASDAKKAKLIGLTVVSAGLISLALGGVLCVVIIAFGRGDLVLPVAAWFLFWQLQEALRRGLFAEFRHQAALLGDSVSYVGQVIVVAALALVGDLTLPLALFSMAFTSALAALVQSRQLTLDLRVGDLSPASLSLIAKDFWSLGSWALGNHLVSLLRIQTFPWLLAASYGPAAAASFQAALNVVNLANPVVIGLGNLIPQAAARELSRGFGVAWAVARSYAIIGFIPLLLYYAIAILWPGPVLTILYGVDSPYLTLADAVRILAIAWVLGYAADMICSFLHGVGAARRAFGINGLGALAAVITAVPLISAMGPSGGFFALAVSSLIRTGAAYFTLNRMSANDRPRYA